MTLPALRAGSSRFVGLLGGATLTKRAAGDVWSYPNVHGDVAATASASGAKQGASTGAACPGALAAPCTRAYDPFGQALSGVPDNSQGGYDCGWLGQHLRGTETEQGRSARGPMWPASGRSCRWTPSRAGAAATTTTSAATQSTVSTSTASFSGGLVT